MFLNKSAENSTRLGLACMILVQVSVLSFIPSTGWASDSSESVSVSKSTLESNSIGVQDRAAERFEVSWWIQSLFGGLISGLVVLLGFCLKECADRKKARSKDREFLASVCAELRHILPSLVLNYGKTKANLDGVTGQEFKWFMSSI